MITSEGWAYSRPALHVDLYFYLSFWVEIGFECIKIGPQNMVEEIGHQHTVISTFGTKERGSHAS